MPQRFKELYRIPQNIYLNTSPLIVLAGALLLDNETGSVVVQLKIKNISNRTVKSCKVIIKSFESNGSELPGEKEYQYLDIDAKPGDIFGTRVPIVLEHSITRKFSIAVTEAVYDDGNVWQHSFTAWRSFDPHRQSLKSAYKDPEILKQIQLDIGKQCEYVPQVMGGLFFCTCGEISLGTKCNKCGLEYEDVIKALDINELSSHKCDRIDREKAEKKEKQRLEEIEAERVQKEKEERELKARKTTKTIGLGIAAAIVLFVIVFGSVKLVNDVLSPEIRYRTALGYYEDQNYNDAKSIFEELNGYKSSEAMALDCIYKSAENYERNNDYDSAVSLWNEIPNYSDSLERIKDYNYNAAVALMESGDYEAAITAFDELDGYKDSATQIEACQTAIKDNNYNAAVSLINSGDFIAAYEALGGMNGYKDSDNLQTSIKFDYEIALLNKASAGDSIYFGTYHQDNDFSNSREDIEWIVLAREGNKILVTSRYALVCKSYNSIHQNVTWENCSLRKWLNSTFFNDAFTFAEQAYIPTVTVTADKNPEYSTNSGNDTQDKVFLLSIQEAEKYFSSDLERMCTPTAHAMALGAYTNDDYKTADGKAVCLWWLRSPGDSSDDAACVDYDGSVFCIGYRVNSVKSCVRPTMWINLEE